VVALIGAIDMPIIYLAADWWRSAHPALMVGPLSGPESSMDAKMGLTLLVSLIAFTFLYAYLLAERLALRNAETAVDEFYRHVH
jgi:heme exporter protein C